MAQSWHPRPTLRLCRRPLLYFADAKGYTYNTTPGGHLTEQQILTVAQLAEKLTMSKNHIYILVRDRRIPHIRIGWAVRFNADEIDAWLVQRSTKEVR